MDKISKFLPYAIFHCLTGLIICFVFSFWYSPTARLLPGFVFGWKVRTGILYFIFYFPFIFISSIILGYSIIFGRFGPISISRGSSLMIAFIRSVFILIIGVVVFFVVLSEVVRPILIEKQEIALQKTISYNEYKKLAQEAYEREDYLRATSHIHRALSVWPKSEDALKFSETIKISYESFSIENNLNDKDCTDDLSIHFKYTPEEALKIAQRAMLSLDFYTAHYYAKLAFNSFNETNILKQNAEDLAKYAWAQIEKGMAQHLEQAEIIRFERKQMAYETMQAGNFIKAYYDFLELHKELDDCPDTKRDPEIDRFLQIARQNLLKNTFFLDELENIPNFDLNKNIKFQVDFENNLYLNIYGLSRSYSENGLEIYLINTELTKKIGDKIEWTIFMPYAKIVQVEVDGKEKLFLQIKAVGKNDRNSIVSPKIVAGEFPIDSTDKIFLPMTFRDFRLIEQASFGPPKMKLYNLFAFISIAEKYGFKKISYVREIVFRLSEPLLVLIVSILAIILSWRFRLTPGKKFKKIWFIAILLCLFLAYILMETSRYICRLFIALFVSVAPTFSPYIILGILILCFFIVSILLFFQKAE